MLLGRRDPLDYEFGVSIAYLRGNIEPWKISLEWTLSRHVSRLKTESKRGKMTPKIRTTDEDAHGAKGRLKHLVWGVG